MQSVWTWYFFSDSKIRPQSFGSAWEWPQAKPWDTGMGLCPWISLTWAHLTLDTRNLSTQHFHTREVSLCIHVRRHPLLLTYETELHSIWLRKHNSLDGQMPWSFRLANLNYKKQVHLHTWNLFLTCASGIEWDQGIKLQTPPHPFLYLKNWSQECQVDEFRAHIKWKYARRSEGVHLKQERLGRSMRTVSKSSEGCPPGERRN